MSRTRKQPDSDDTSQEGWPEAVPILSARDIVWNYSTADGRRDLEEWLEHVFAPNLTTLEPKEFREAYRTLCRVISTRLNRRVRILGLFLEEAKKNKTPSKAWQAACWNEALSQLGYSVDKNKTKDPGLV